MDLRQICKNCGEIIYIDYYDFCSPFCCMNFSKKYNLLLIEAKNCTYRNEMKDLIKTNHELERELDDYEDEICDLRNRLGELQWIKDKYEELIKDINDE